MRHDFLPVFRGDTFQPVAVQFKDPAGEPIAVDQFVANMIIKQNSTDGRSIFSVDLQKNPERVNSFIIPSFIVGLPQGEHFYTVQIRGANTVRTILEGLFRVK